MRACTRNIIGEPSQQPAIVSGCAGIKGAKHRDDAIDLLLRGTLIYEEHAKEELQLCDDLGGLVIDHGVQYHRVCELEVDGASPPDACRASSVLLLRRMIRHLHARLPHWWNYEPHNEERAHSDFGGSL